MRCLTRYCSLFLAVLVLFGVFSLNVEAKESVDFKLNHHVGLNVPDMSMALTTYDLTFFPLDSAVDSETQIRSYSMGDDWRWFTIGSSYTFFPSESNFLLEEGLESRVTLGSLYFAFKLDNNYDWEQWVDSFSSSSLLVTYEDYSQEYITNYSVNKSSYYLFDVVFEIVPKQNIKQIEFICGYGNSARGTLRIHSYLGEQFGAGFTFDVQADSKETSLLGKIKDGISSLVDGILSLPSKIWGYFQGAFDNITSWFSKVYNSVVELPSKIWAVFENGLKSLIVPSEDFVLDYKLRFENLALEKLGAVWQIEQILIDSWDWIGDVSAVDSITLPSVEIPVGDDSTFTFGGYEVVLIPNGFEWLVFSVKLICGISVTLLFVNGLRKRLEEFLGIIGGDS